ncbi:YdcF family protein, partial [Candidatus Pelagibacter sp.]|nr:YdcF family protein [Candidatus Pelagibacter sp.]
MNKLKKIRIILIIGIFLIFYSPIPNLIVYNFEKLNEPGNIENLKMNYDKIVILSGNEDVKKTKKFNHYYLGGSNNRLIEGLRLHYKYKKEVIFSGSSLVKSGDLREIYVAKNFFESFKVNENLLTIDGKSKNTEDTFLFLKKNFKNDRHLIVTSAMHMQRCKLLAEKHNIKFILYPVDYLANHDNPYTFNFNLLENIRLFNYGLREVSALALYKLMGRI